MDKQIVNSLEELKSLADKIDMDRSEITTIDLIVNGEKHTIECCGELCGKCQDAAFRGRCGLFKIRRNKAGHKIYHRLNECKNAEINARRQQIIDKLELDK